ncbi:hypothetical protein RI367_003586 [Sorochytrium milnesiophthora]
MAATVTAQNFFSNPFSDQGHARVHLCVWMALLALLFLVDGTTRRKMTTETTSTRALNAAGATEVTTVDVYERRVTLADRFRRAVRAARLNFLLLFTATLVSVLGHGATSGTVALLWIALAIGVLWVVTDLAVDIPLVRFVYSLGVFTLVLIIWGLSFRSNHAT